MIIIFKEWLATQLSLSDTDNTDNTSDTIIVTKPQLHKPKPAKRLKNGRWGVKEDAFLKASYQKFDVAELSKKMNRSITAIQNRAQKLGLVRQDKETRKKFALFLAWLTKKPDGSIFTTSKFLAENDNFKKPDADSAIIIAIQNRIITQVGDESFRLVKSNIKRVEEEEND